MLNICDQEDVSEARRKFADVADFREQAFQRARVWLEIDRGDSNSETPDFLPDNEYYSPVVSLHELLFGEGEAVTFTEFPVRREESPVHFNVPRDFIFAEPTDREKEVAEFLSLKSSLGF